MNLGQTIPFQLALRTFQAQEERGNLLISRDEAGGGFEGDQL